MEKIKEIIEQYKTYILIGIVIILIIIIGFMYSNNVTNKIENTKIEEKVEIKEEKEENKKVYIDIKGEVKHPGVYELYDYERVIDAIKKADGLTNDADTSYLNLSKKLKDEMTIIIYSKDEIKEYEKNLKEDKIKEIVKYEIVEKEIPCPNTTNESCINNVNKKESNNDIKEEKNNLNEEKTNKEELNSQDNKLVDLNKATKEELLTLQGIGESKADQILDYRNNNKFNSIEDIKNIKGIGDSLFEKIKDSITV